MKRYLYILLSLFASIAFVACNNEVGMPSGGETSPESMKLLLKVKNEGTSAATRAGTEVGSDIENKITSLDIFFYHAQDLNLLYHRRITLTPGSTPEADPNWVVTDDATGNKIITIPLDSWFDMNTPMHVFVYANIPLNDISETSDWGQTGYDYTALTTDSGKFNAKFLWGLQYVSESNLIPMEGHLLNKTFSLNDLTVNIPLKRVWAKIRYKITFAENSTTEDFDLTTVDIQAIGVAQYSPYTPLAEFGVTPEIPLWNVTQLDKWPEFQSNSFSNHYYICETGTPVVMKIMAVHKGGDTQTFTIPVADKIDRNYIYDMEITIRGIGGGNKLGLEMNIIPWTVLPLQPEDDDAVGTYTFIPHYSKFYLDEGECYFDFIYGGAKYSRVVLTGETSAFSMTKQTGTPSDGGAYESTVYTQISFPAGTAVNKRIKIKPYASTVGEGLPDRAVTYSIYIGSEMVESHKVEYQSISVLTPLRFSAGDLPTCDYSNVSPYGTVVLTMPGVVGGKKPYTYNWWVSPMGGTQTCIDSSTETDGTFRYDMLSHYDHMNQDYRCIIIDANGKELSSDWGILPTFMN